MNFDELFLQFINILSSTENAFEVSQQAVSLIAGPYQIGQILVYFKVKSTSFTPGGVETERVAYRADAFCPGGPMIHREYRTGENGMVQLTLTGLSGETHWDERQQAELEMILNVLFMHLGRSRLIHQVQKNAMSDFMTGLPNADGYMRYVSKLYRRGELIRYNAYYFNLKGFSLVNRKFGQRETDSILKRYAAHLRQFTDGDELVGRLGGDNFVALIRKERTEAFLQLLAGVETYGMVGSTKVPVIVRAVSGVLEIDETLQGCEAILSETAIALKVARYVEKRPYVFATREMNSRVYRQKQISAKFPEAIQGGEFIVYYQPKVDTNTYQIVGAEALVRWLSEGELLCPGEFIPILERDDSVCRLDFYMLEHVCQDIHRWMEQGIEPVRISVNFSRRHLSNPKLSEEVLALIEEYQIPEKYIEIEVTETTDVDEQDRLSEFVSNMRSHRIATAIDDFGTGYSSLNILRSFPINVLKIDKSFIDNGLNADSDSIVLTNIIKMARELHMDVVTEGVETWNQVEFLRDIECNVVQGFLFDRPMPCREFEKRLRMRQYEVSRVADVKPHPMMEQKALAAV